MKAWHRVLLVCLGLISAFVLAIFQTMFDVGVDGELAASFLFWWLVHFVALSFPFWLPALLPNGVYLRRVCGVFLLFPCYIGITILLKQVPKLLKDYATFSPFDLTLGVTVTMVSAIAAFILFFATPAPDKERKIL